MLGGRKLRQTRKVDQSHVRSRAKEHRQSRRYSWAIFKGLSRGAEKGKCVYWGDKPAALWRINLRQRLTMESLMFEVVWLKMGQRI